MRYRDLGRTGIKVSETGFGTGTIGGHTGTVEETEALAALAKAEELGCNFVDTASMYGKAEEILGKFLPGRRHKWILATKYSGQAGGMASHAEGQLKKMKTEVIDFYQTHWAPSDKDWHLYEDLVKLKQSGKARFIGVSLRTIEDIDRMLDRTEIDGFQVPMSLLDPLPLLARIDRVREKKVGIIVRSTLAQGFLVGKFRADAQFKEDDSRVALKPEEIRNLVERTERFRFLEKEAGSMLAGAVRYPLSFPEVSTVILGTKSAKQAEVAYGEIPGKVLSGNALQEVREIQVELGLWPNATAT